MRIGSFTFMLHSHMPYVLSHGTSPNGADWLYEAAAETYLPLLETCSRLVDEGISPRIAIGITPVLTEQLRDERFKGGFRRYIAAMSARAQSDEAAFRAAGQPIMAELAAGWRERYAGLIGTFNSRYECDIVGAFADLSREGHIELVASSATHAYSPLSLDDDSIARQVSVGLASHKRHFGGGVRGFWLPECAFRPRGIWTQPDIGDGQTAAAKIRRGVDDILADFGIDYFFAESRVAGATLPSSYGARLDALAAKWKSMPLDNFSPQPSPYTAHRLAANTNSVRVLFRDPATGVRVWSGDTGYPAGAPYLDFHKRSTDLSGIGLRYWAVTDRQQETKAVYDPVAATAQVRRDAEDFASVVAATLTAQPPGGILCATYDTELFGHWWFEGTDFLYHAIRAIASTPGIDRTTPSSYLDTSVAGEAIDLAESSWGAGGSHAVWLNDQTAWVWRLIYAAERRMRSVVALRVVPARIMRQLERELLLLQASDWPFLIATGGASDYAAARVRQHAVDFNALADIAERAAAGQEPTSGEWKAVADCEQRDRVFV